MKTHQPIFLRIVLLWMLGTTGISLWAEPAEITPTGNVIYVKVGTAGTGSSWDDATDLALALQWAQTNKDNGLWDSENPLKIYVAAGTYIPSIHPVTNQPPAAGQERDGTFLLVADVQLYGGFPEAGGSFETRDWETNKTTLSGDLDGDDIDNGTDDIDGTFVGSNAYHVVLSVGPVGEALLDGFTISRGNAAISSTLIVNGLKTFPYYGGGMSNHASSPVLTNVIISKNRAGFSGGGMYNDASSPILTNVTLSVNRAYTYGGGMYNVSSSPVLTNVVISGNKINGDGGGIYDDGSSPILTNVTITGNKSLIGDGGGMYVFGNFALPVLTNVTIGGNSAYKGGSELFNSHGNPKLHNTIVWGDSEIISAIHGDIDASSSHNFIRVGEGKILPGNIAPTGLTAADIFAAPKEAGNAPTTAGDYTLNATSPALNKGDNNKYWDAVGAGNPLPETEVGWGLGLSGNPRVYDGDNGGTIDLGAYEYQGEPLAFIRPDANRVYVKEDGTGDGSSWDDATDLVLALQWAQEKVNESEEQWDAANPLNIYVAAGTYTPRIHPVTNRLSGVGEQRDVTFLMVPDVRLYGGFPADATGTAAELATRNFETNRTTLSGDLERNDGADGAIIGDNAYHVVLSVRPVGEALLDGFTISGGHADGSNSLSVNGLPVFAGDGGGMVNCFSSTDLTNVTLSGNWADNDGGGMYNDSSSPLLTNVTISGNRAAAGGGMYNDSSSPLLTNVTISRNRATDGAATYNFDSSLELYNSIVWGNSGVSLISGDIHESSSSNLIEGGDADHNIGDIPENLEATDIFTAPGAAGEVPTTVGDFRLKASSPALNSGDNSKYWGAVGSGADLPETAAGWGLDLAGSPRVYNGDNGSTIDLGAYEYQGEPLAFIRPDANRIYVKEDATGEGSSWDNAADLALALQWAQGQVDEQEERWDAENPLKIYVAAGTYIPSIHPVTNQPPGADEEQRDVTFLMVPDVQLYGGFPANGTGTAADLAARDFETDVTILSGDLEGNDRDGIFMGSNAYHVAVSAGPVGEALLDGFTLTGGNANNVGSLIVNGREVLRIRGGGMTNCASSPDLTNVTFSVNGAGYGGGLYNESSTSVLTNVTLSGNSAAYGGGMYNYFYATPVLTNVTLHGNRADDGGGMYNGTSSPVLTNVTISGNRSTLSGGGMANRNNSSPVLTNVILSGNSAVSGDGGGMYNSSARSPVLRNVTFSGNWAGGRGGGMYNEYSSPKLYNSVVWGNELVNGLNGNPTYSHSLVEGQTGEGIIDADGVNPSDIFVDYDPVASGTPTTAGDYRLKQGGANPAINAGDNAVVSTNIDRDGNPRVRDDRVDLGAYEVQEGNRVAVVHPADRIIYVKEGAAGDGSSWADATDLATALQWAQANRDNGLWDATDPLKIYVAAGTYIPKIHSATNQSPGTGEEREVTFQLVNGVELYGGFPEDGGSLDTRDWEANETLLSGNLGDPADDADNAYHVFYHHRSGLDATAVLDGFTITGGNADGGGNHLYGGGMYNGGEAGSGGSSPTLRHVVLSGNQAFNGGGMYNEGSSPVLTNVTISGNSAGGDGGGMFNDDSSPVLTNVTISGNRAGSGGGMSNQEASNPVLTNVTISGNWADGYGGGMLNDDSSPKLYNSVVWGNELVNGLNGNPTYSHSLVEGQTGEGIIDADGVSPSDIFVDYNPVASGIPTTAGDYRLKQDGANPAINAGDNAVVSTNIDRDGNPRVRDDRVDLGAYEVQEGNRVAVIHPADRIIHVKEGTAGDGSSWADATDLATALQWAQANRDNGLWDATDPLKIYVAAGTYIPKIHPVTNQPPGVGETGDATFLMVRDVQMYGGFPRGGGSFEARDWETYKTTLSGDFAGDDGTDGTINGDNAYHVVVSAGAVGDALLNGFILSGGYANGSGSLNINDRAVYRARGGGMTNVDFSSPVLMNVTISGNSADEYGGGMANAASSSPVLTNVTISGNRADYGGGMYNVIASSPVLANVTISGNYATREGGGMVNMGSSPVLTNVTISGNLADYGDGMYNFSSSPKLYNSVVLGNDIENLNESNPTYSHSLVAEQTGDGNIDAAGVNPSDIFVDYVAAISGTPTTGGDFRLKAGSPAVNAGSDTFYEAADGNAENESLTNDHDLGGQPRRSGGAVDLGAYESPYDNLASVADGDLIEVAFGTDWSAVSLPGDYTVPGTLASGTAVELAVRGNTADWTLVAPAGGSYDGNTAGDYVFETPLLLPGPEDADWFSSVQGTDNARITVRVDKGEPMLTVEWNGAAVDATEGLSLTYGDSGGLTVGSTDPEAEIKVTYAYGSGGADVLAPGAVAARQAGTATLTVSQETTANYKAASVAFTVTVARKAVTIVPLEGQGKVYGAGDPEAYGYELAENDRLAFDDELTDIVSSSARAEGQDVGEYNIELTFGGALADNYAITFDADNDAFTITPLEIAVTAENQTKVFGTDDPELTYTFAPALNGDDGFTGALTRNLGDNVGSYGITQGDLSLSANYELTFEGATLTVDPAEIPGITLDDGRFVYDGMARSLAITGTLPDGASVTYDIDGKVGNSAINARTYEVTATIDGGINYEDAELTATLTITPLEITVTAENQTKVFGAADPTLTYTYSPELIGDDQFTGALSRDAGDNVGSHAITEGSLALDDNYNLAFVSAILRITRAPVTFLTLPDLQVTYDGDAHVLEVTGNLPDGASVTYDIDGKAGNRATDAGTYQVTAHIDGGANYEDAELPALLTIAPLKIEVTAESQTKVFGTDDPALTYTYSPELISDDQFTGALIRDAGEDVGNYRITKGSLFLNDNYDLAFEPDTFIITRAAVTDLTLPDLPVTYNGTAHALELMGNLPPGTSVIYEIDGKAGNRASDAGTYEVTAHIDGGINYKDATLAATLTIAPLEIMVTAETQTKIFGTDDPALTYMYSPQLIGDDQFRGTLSRDAGEDRGNYSITRGDLSLSDNYDIIFEPSMLTIILDPALFITLEDASYVYDGTAKSLAIAGHLSEDITITYAGNSRTEVGKQEVTATVTSGHIDPLVLRATLEILPAERTLTFPELSARTYGDTDFKGGGTSSSGETITYSSSNTAVATVVDGRIRVVGAGTAVITATVPENENYASRPEARQVLTVNKAPQSVTLNAPTEVRRDVGMVPLEVSTSSPLPVSLLLDDSEVATLEETTLHIHRLGTVRITAVLDGDANYEAADPVTVTVRVIDPSSDFPIRVSKVVSPNGDGINEYLIIEAIKDYPDNRVRIFNRNGMVVYEASGYNNGTVAFHGVGTGQHQVPAGTYFYTAEIRVNGEWEYRKGWFVLRY